MLSYNKTKMTQIIYAPRDAYPVTVQPKAIIDLSGYKDFNPADFAQFNIEMINGTDSITIHRDYALGDLIQLIPVARMIKKKLGVKSINIITTERFREDLSYLYSDLRILSKDWLYAGSSGIDLGFIFCTNGILERDHSTTNKENQKHRVDIYLKFFGITDYDASEIEWDIRPKGGIIVPSIKTDKKIIGVQLRGSGCMKTLPKPMMMSIIHELAKEHYVVLIDHDKNMGFEGTNIINMCGKLKTPQVIALLKQIDMCITMDSGVLWMCHSANCPTLTFLASTREAERISLHPQYPHKAKAIDLTKYIGCEPCFETKVNCKGKIRCMTEVNYDMIKDELLEKVKSILGVQ